MNKIVNILLIVGAMLLVFSSVITFKTDLPQRIENIIYFRGILLGSSLMIFSIALILKEQIIMQSILLSLSAGNFALLLMSTYNLLADELIDLDKYFDWTMSVTAITLIILLFIRLWLNKLLTLLNS